MALRPKSKPSPSPALANVAHAPAALMASAQNAVNAAVAVAVVNGVMDAVAAAAVSAMTVVVQASAVSAALQTAARRQERQTQKDVHRAKAVMVAGVVSAVNAQASAVVNAVMPMPIQAKAKIKIRKALILPRPTQRKPALSAPRVAKDAANVVSEARAGVNAAASEETMKRSRAVCCQTMAARRPMRPVQCPAMIQTHQPSQTTMTRAVPTPSGASAVLHVTVMAVIAASAQATAKPQRHRSLRKTTALRARMHRLRALISTAQTHSKLHNRRQQKLPPTVHLHRLKLIRCA